MWPKQKKEKQTHPCTAWAPNLDVEKMKPVRFHSATPEQFIGQKTFDKVHFREGCNLNQMSYVIIYEWKV